MPDTAAALARDLLRIGAVALRPADPFTWASGRRSPIYTDNRLTLSHPDVRGCIADAFADLSRPFSPDAISATATAGIPHGALLADRLELPFSYVRSAPKGHGKENRIEGAVADGARVVLVEDLISTGGSALSAAQALRQHGVDVVAVVAVFSYGFPEAEAAFDSAGIPLATLTGLDALARAARETGTLAEADRDTLDAWRRDPAGWSERWVGQQEG
ncbi:orotate phosphoribosyltransferase [Rubrivirga sp. IMCC45206]|uniref:orotate phosphoribosyltransferase n=1 Tax=Rubrivirga sp. IMCC45206 TaxID=3391614 RepID=UPI0039902221